LKSAWIFERKPMPRGAKSRRGSKSTCRLFLMTSFPNGITEYHHAIAIVEKLFNSKPFALVPHSHHASQYAVRQAMRASLIPTVNGLMVVGIVTLPGMMT